VQRFEEQELVDAARTDRLTEVSQQRTGWRALDRLQEVFGPDGTRLDIDIFPEYGQGDAVAFLDFLCPVGAECTAPCRIQPGCGIAAGRGIVCMGWLSGLLDIPKFLLRLGVV
jgi:hypothetical protein